MQPDANYHAGQLATSGVTASAGVTWLWQQWATYGPSWALIPPLLLSMSSVVGAVWSARKMAQDLRHREEVHQVRLAALRARAAAGTLDVEALPERSP